MKRKFRSLRQQLRHLKKRLARQGWLWSRMLREIRAMRMEIDTLKQQVQVNLYFEPMDSKEQEERAIKVLRWLQKYGSRSTSALREDQES